MQSLNSEETIETQKGIPHPNQSINKSYVNFSYKSSRAITFKKFFESFELYLLKDRYYHDEVKIYYRYYDDVFFLNLNNFEILEQIGWNCTNYINKVRNLIINKTGLDLLI